VFKLLIIYSDMGAETSSSFIT